MIKVLIYPFAENIDENNGIGRVIHAQYRHLPTMGINLVTDPAEADIIAVHTQQHKMPRVDVLHCHGLYWTGDPWSGNYDGWHHDANVEIVRACRRAEEITVPSPWVAMPFKRDMRLSPTIIGHGIELDQWKPGNNGGYILWNKNRRSDVCNPYPAFVLARKGFVVRSTFAPVGEEIPPTMHVMGNQSHEQMQGLVADADIYLATTQETFGIGTLEAMACGVPVLGFAWAGTNDIIRHQETGYLVEPNDYDGLVNGIKWIREHRQEMSEACIEESKNYSWAVQAKKYADCYKRVAKKKTKQKPGCTIVVTNHNYGQYVGRAIESCLGQQTEYPVEIIVVDDGSTDNSKAVLKEYEEKVRVVYQANQGVAAARNNGVRMAKYQHVCCLDADDQYDPRFVEFLLPAMLKDRQLGIAYGAIELLQEDGKVVYVRDWPPPFSWVAQATPHVPPSNCVPTGSMFRKDMWERCGGFRQEYAPGEDAEFWTHGLSIGFTAERVTDLPLLRYFAHSGSESRIKRYVPIDTWHPWMTDKQFPIGAPAMFPPKVRSYSQPMVSVVIPVGPGHEEHAQTAIQSVVGQTYRDWECIVVWDSDKEPDLDIYPFLNIIRTDARSAASARNLGINSSNAPLIAFLDADDYFLPGFLKACIKEFAEHGGRYIYTDWYRSEKGGMKSIEVPNYDPRMWGNEGLHGINVVITTEAAKRIRFDESLKAFEDVDFFMRCAIDGVHGHRYPFPMVVIRSNLGGHWERDKHRIEYDSVRGKYKEFFTGGKPMGSCCGGGGKAVLRSKASIKSDVKVEASNPEVAIVGGDVIRMEFTGMQEGNLTFKGKNGRKYKGGATYLHRYADVHPEDVEVLMRTNKWRVVNPAIPR